MTRKRSVLKEWGISYIIILLIPFVAIMINYYCNLKVIQEEITQANQFVLQNLKDNIDNYLSSEQEMFEYFYFDQTQKNIINAEEKSVAFYEDVCQFQSKISAYGSTDISMIYSLSLESMDYIMDSHTSHNSFNVYSAKKMLNSNLPEYELWMEFMNAEYTREFFVSNYIAETNTGPCIVYANSSYVAGGGKANVFISIPSSAIENITSHLEDGSLLVVNFASGSEMVQVVETGRPKLLVLNHEGVVPLSEDILAVIGNGNMNPEKDTYVEIHIASSIKEVSYSLLIPKEVFGEKSVYVRNILFVCLVVALVTGLGMIGFLLRRNFQPVSALLKNIGNDDGTNEFDQIERAYKRIFHESGKMKKRLEYQEDMLNQNRLLSLLKGRMPQAMDIKEQGAAFQNADGNFALVGFWLPAYDGDRAESDELNFFAADNIISELFEKEQMKKTEDGRFLFYLFQFHDEDVMQWKERCLNHFRFVCEFLEDKLQIVPKVVMSSVEQDISCIRQMYQDIMEAFEYQRMVGGEDVVTVEELQIPEPNAEKQLHLYYTALTKLLEHGKPEEVGRMVDLLRQMSEKASFTMIRLRILEAYQEVSEIFNRRVSDNEQRMLLPFLESLLDAGEISVIYDRYEKLLCFAMGEIQRQQESDYKGIAEDVREYIEKNYTDCGLNISTIAERIGRNPQYISKVFKEVMEEGILDYLNRVRISKAQVLLLQNDRSIERICEEVGYASVRTFRRAFMKVTGIMPNEYRGK